ncbi:LOW QUALITY PROTEIN: DNA polymerase subunit gamma-1, mitochondrial [Drosophila busckii]|uniref:LOW QUALITY PROTEIN: DNA polymerase subunit gamma-1, mitochondrial n=1 Tax=Drosophila busckii TaxID=30019 RepID=UPI001432C384|nr:LOW QUALITY PROTEIN: DNA polymerase subunit gamma-1, mitochondrial [Drosophila busckii]
MRLLRNYATKASREHYASSSLKIYRKLPSTSQLKSKYAPRQNPRSRPNSEYAENLVKVQMISKNLHRQIFPQAKREYDEPQRDAATRYNAELLRHGIDVESGSAMPDVELKLPPLRGKNIEEHFYSIAKEQVTPYEALLQPLVDCAQLPAKPKRWLFQTGWTAYDEDGSATPVDKPMEQGIVFDVEVCVREGSAPVLATAVSTKRWYCWVSSKLTKHRTNVKPVELCDAPENERPHYTPDELIPLGTGTPGLVVGHNVCYDRARLQEQYLLEDAGTRFVDTMSLHMCVSGVTSYQRALLKSKKEPAEEDLAWLEQSALNSLVEVHRLYCGGPALSKEPRNIFVEGTLEQVRQHFQALVNYCASDVEATQRILRVLYPMYAQRFPHPASLAGMLEMGCAYLPVNGNWERYIREAQLTYEDLSIEAKYHLGRRAEEACALLQDEQYKQHLWLWDEDWSVQKLKLKQAPKRKALPTAPMPDEGQLNEEQRRLQRKFQHLYDQQALLPARRPLLPGYPQWYRKLCRKPPSNYNEELDEEEPWLPGASEISTGMQLAPKLLSLCWEGYPLHYQREHGWGFLVPFRRADQQSTLPLDQLLERCAIPEFARQFAAAEEGNAALELLPRQLEEHLGKRQFHKKISQQQQRLEQQYKGAGVWCNQVLDDCCFFLKLPHKNGPSYRVGNPLSKDFLNKFSEHALSSGDTSCHAATRVIEIARMMSYWRNNRDRILNQMVVWLQSEQLPAELKPLTPSLAFGAICPQVVVAGTLTRRAMEPTWMTASNSRANRIGSELRAMVQAPPGYKLVGADVDSQELWIASVLGDAYAHGQHGATPLGWMTLSGSKSNGSDMHSSTAKVVGISRDHAKVLNYARIYGAGQQFAETLLQQFNPSLSATEAKAKAMKMFAATKGKRVYRLREEYHDELEDRSYSGYEATRLAAQRNRIVSELFHRPRWQGGTESAMFNRLEEIATREQPQTPFLNCRLSRALESAGGSEQEQRFLPTRVNWVVQSGAVDFLHLMLVSMRWLLGPHARFCLSFHDELRYLVKEELAYKAALAMHITNLLTRAFCASRLGLNDLPMSVAFFSSVEVDTVLRKECTMDCQTPSNPHGLQIGYGIPAGQTLSIQQAIEQAGGNDLTQWAWLKRQTS